MAEITEVASGLGFPEGPIWMPDGSVLISDDASNRLFRVSYGQ